MEPHEKLRAYAKILEDRLSLEKDTLRFVEQRESDPQLGDHVRKIKGQYPRAIEAYDQARWELYNLFPHLRPTPEEK